MIKHLNLIIPVFIILLFPACTKDIVDLTGNIHGTVIDAKTGTPLSGVEVDISPDHQSRTTGNDGTYIFDELSANTYTVQAKKDGYKSDTRTPRVEAGSNVILDFALQPLSPVLSVSPTTVDFGSESTSQIINIKNIGEGTLNWHISEDIPWLTCNPLSGSNTNVGQASVTLTISRDGLEKGEYRQSIAIASDGGSAVVNVSMMVQGATISYSPDVLDYGSSTSVLELVLTNTGSGSLSYTLTPSDNWIIPNRTSGTFARTENITVSVKRTDLSEGNYEGKLKLQVADEVFPISVRMRILPKSLPTVSLIGIDDVTYNSASIKGSVIDVGSSSVKHYGFVWSTTETPDVSASGKCDFGSVSTAKDFSYKVMSLSENTTYYVRSYAENAEGTAYSSQMQFTTKQTPKRPTVQTGEVSNIQAKQVDVAGTVTNMGDEAGIIQHGHVYATTSNPTIDNNHTELGERQATGNFLSTLTGLEPGKTYHVRAYATNSLGTSYGEDVVFQTEPDVMTLTTIEVTDITHEAVTTGGSISYLGGNEIEERGVCWSTSSNPTIANDHKSSTDKTSRFSVRVTGLSELTGYHVRAYVTAANGKTYYGNDVSFSTTYEIKMPVASSTSVSSIGTHEALLNASVVNDGNGTIKECGFCYSTTPNPTIDGTHISGNIQSASFSAKLTGLRDNTTYYVRSYVTNEAGTAYGEEVNFATLEITLPTLSPVTLGRVTHKAASFEATVLSEGNSNVTAVGFVYSTSSNPTLSDHRVECRLGEQISGQVKSLSPSTTYYVRAYATNEKGTAYSEEKSFTTAEEPSGSDLDIDDFGDEDDWN